MTRNFTSFILIAILSMSLYAQEKVEVMKENNELISEAIEEQNIEKFDSIAKVLNYKGGDIVKVFVRFTVTENGEIKDVKARGPHPLFELEAEKVVKLIPKLDLKKFKNGNKEMKFSLPINFVIQTEQERKAQARKEKRKKERELKKRNKKS